MLRYFLGFLLVFPFLSIAFHQIYHPFSYGNFCATQPAETAGKKVAKPDPLKLKREDLLEKEDKGWYPELQAIPEEYYEEMELPKRAEADDDSAAS